eukprot:1157508-Pelagomonas_calceolata.AAC.5
MGHWICRSHCKRADSPPAHYGLGTLHIFTTCSSHLHHPLFTSSPPDTSLTVQPRPLGALHVEQMSVGHFRIHVPYLSAFWQGSAKYMAYIYGIGQPFRRGAGCAQGWTGLFWEGELQETTRPFSCSILLLEALQLFTELLKWHLLGGWVAGGCRGCWEWAETLCCLTMFLFLCRVDESLEVQKVLELGKGNVAAAKAIAVHLDTRKHTRMLLQQQAQAQEQ